MNMLIKNGVIAKMKCGSNFAYVLNYNSTFLSTEYKVLQSQANSCFVKCMKMTFNGKLQLFYLTKGLKSFASMIPAMDSESFLTIAANLLSDIINVNLNGFLSCKNIDIAFEHIFVNPATYKVSLVYLPLSKHIYEDNSSFENELRTGLVKLITDVPALSSPKTRQFSSSLSDGTLGIEDLYARIKGTLNNAGATVIGAAYSALLSSISLKLKGYVSSVDSYENDIAAYNKKISETDQEIAALEALAQATGTS